jgi:hypothetical protein
MTSKQVANRSHDDASGCPTFKLERVFRHPEVRAKRASKDDAEKSTWVFVPASVVSRARAVRTNAPRSRAPCRRAACCGCAGCAQCRR